MRVARLTAFQRDHPDQGVLPQDEPTAGILNTAAFLRTESTVGAVASARNTSNARVTMDAVTPYATPQP